MSILEPLALNWFQCQIRLVLILGYNTKVIVWMQMKLLDGIKEQANTDSCLDVNTCGI